MDVLVKDQDYPENCSFITNVDNIWFLYTFKNRKFSSRHFYFTEDIGSLKKKNIYFLDIFNERKAEKKHKFLEIGEGKIVNSLSKLKNDIFKIKSAINFKKNLIYVLSASFVLFMIFLQIYSIKLSNKKNDLLKESVLLNQKYDSEKAKRGISDEMYKEYLKLFSKKSNVNDFFKNLYHAGNNNIEIERFNFSDNAFTVSGFCSDDSKLENAFRLSHSWKDVVFTFTKKNNKIQFNISGKFINEN
jgi:preprotein translocase subunit SecG